MQLDAVTLNLSRLHPKSAIDAGVVLVPEKRIDEGLAVSKTIVENITLPWHRYRGGRGPLSWKKLVASVVPQMQALDVRPMDPHAVVGHLSGGNQQKVLLAKWLMRPPKLLVMHEPTQAVDVGARNAILRAVDTIADRGTAVVYASAQPADLVEICDRILCFRAGRFVEVTDRTQEAILAIVYSEQQGGKQK